jgi:hypothetical protein
MRSEMRQHSSYQITNVPHLELERLVRSVRSDEPAFPFRFDHVEQFGSICVLADRETRSNLPAESMTIARLERNAETTFTIHESGDVGVQVHRQGSGPACYGLSAIQGSHPLSRYGDRIHVRSYPRYYPRHPCTERRWGSTDLSRLNETVSPPFRAMLLTRQGISLP